MNKRSNQELAEAVKDLAEIKKIDDSPMDGGNTIIGTPARTTDVPIGSRDAILISIDLSIKSEFKYLVKFPETQRTVFARIKNELGVHWAPNGKFKTQTLFLCEPNTNIHCEIIKDTLKWQISGAENSETIIEPGATVIKRGDSTVTTHNNGITISNKDLELTVDGEWAYINGKKICVKGSCFTTWIIPNNVSVWVANGTHLAVFDLLLKEWVDVLQVDNLTSIAPQTGSVVFTEDRRYDINIQSGSFTKNISNVVNKFTARGIPINADGTTDVYANYPGMIDFISTDVLSDSWNRYFYITKTKLVAWCPEQVDPTTGTGYSPDILNLIDDEFISIIGVTFVPRFLYVLGKNKIYKIGARLYPGQQTGGPGGNPGGLTTAAVYFYVVDSWEHGFIAQRSYTDDRVGPDGAFLSVGGGVYGGEGATGYPIYTGSKIYLYNCLTKTSELIPNIGSFASGSYMTNQNSFSAIYSVTGNKLLINPLVGDKTQQAYDIPINNILSLGIQIGTQIQI